MSGKYSQKVLDQAKKSATDALKTSSKTSIQKPGGATGDLIGNKIADAVAMSYDKRITKISKIHKKIIQRQLQMRIIKKYVKKDISLQTKDKNILMMWYLM